MDDPVRDIPKVIHALCQSSPSVQHDTIEKYFAPDAAFTHPFCRTGSFSCSRILIEYIYRWYKILSPNIDLRVYSVAFDEPNLLLYVSLKQTFRIQFLPFYRADANLTTVLQLTRSIASPEQSASMDDQKLTPLPVLTASPKYHIQSQNDLYQTNEFVKFAVPWFGMGHLIVTAWQFFITLQCVIWATVLQPITWIEEGVGAGEKVDVASVSQIDSRLSGNAILN